MEKTKRHVEIWKIPKKLQKVEEKRIALKEIVRLTQEV